MNKTHVWATTGQSLGLPQGVQVESLPILGAKLSADGDDDDAPHTFGAAPGADLGKAIDGLRDQ
eukprot:3989428-Lingulodinium_polyedra.AAC.1